MSRCDRFKWSEHITEENWQPGAAMNCSVCQFLGKEECPIKSCGTCVFGATCGQPTRDRDDCLPGYKHYKYGDPEIRFDELRNSGQVNIVIGGEGEHEVNVNWSIDQAYKHLSSVCEDCGGLCWKERKDLLILDKPYHGGFNLEYEGGKLKRILMETRQTPKFTWWEADDDLPTM